MIQLYVFTLGLPSLKERFEKTAEQLVHRLVLLQREEIEALVAFKDAVVDREFADVGLLVFDRENEELINKIETLTRDKDNKQVSKLTINNSSSCIKLTYTSD